MVSISLGYFKDELISMYRMLRTESAGQEYPINVMCYYCGCGCYHCYWYCYLYYFSSWPSDHKGIRKGLSEEMKIKFKRRGKTLVYSRNGKKSHLVGTSRARKKLVGN